MRSDRKQENWYYISFFHSKLFAHHSLIFYQSLMLKHQLQLFFIDKTIQARLFSSILLLLKQEFCYFYQSNFYLAGFYSTIQLVFC